MSYIVESVTIDDAPGVARAMFSAFWEDPHWRKLWAEGMNLETIIRECTERLPWQLIDSRKVKRHLKAVDATSGEIVGYSRYIVPDDQSDIWHEAQSIEPTEEQRFLYQEQFKQVTIDGRIRGMNYEMLSELGSPLEQNEKEILKQSGPCFAIDYMATHPRHQGRGVASMMAREALRHVDSAGLKSIVMASPAGRKVYEKLGFQLTDTLAQDYKKYGLREPYTHHWLIRPSRT